MIALEDLLLFSLLRFWKMLVEGLLLMGGAELGKYLLNKGMEVGEGAVKDYLQGFFKGKLGDVVDKFKLELKAAMEKAIGGFMKLFIKQLLSAGVTDKIINGYYVSSIESFIKDEDIIELLGKAFDADFNDFDDKQIIKIKNIWLVYFKARPVFTVQFDDKQIIKIKNIWPVYFKARPTFPVKFDWQLLLDNYEIKVKEIRRADEKLRKILDSETLQSIDDGIETLISITQKSVDAAKKTYEIQKSNSPIPIEFNLDRYRERLQGSYGRLKLGKLESKGKHDIQLVKIFIEQNVREDLPPDPSPNPDSDESTQNRRQYLEKSPEPVLKVIRDENCQRAVLLGEPGSGKSSLLQYLALDWAEGKTKRLPLLIELRECAIERFGEKNFLDFLSGGASANCTFDRHQLHEYLRTKDSLVMFDGLDEIFDRKLRESTIGKIVSFATQDYPKAKIVITSRLVGYERDLLGVEFQHFTLQELDESQIHEFIDKWHQLALGEDPRQEQLKRQLKEAIDRSPAIRILANNPLLLTLMATLNKQGSLPTRRVDLYNLASQLLLHNWDLKGNKLSDPSLQAIDAPEKQAILGKIAYEMQSKVGLAGNLIRSQQLKPILKDHFKKEDDFFQDWKDKAHRLIEQLTTRSFIFCAYGADAYGFIHRTFLEYFCARDFVRQHDEEPLYSLKQLRDEVFDWYWQDETWHEVLKLICGLLEPEQAGYLVEFLMDREVDRADYLDYQKQATTGAFQHLLLATECWAEVKSPKPRSIAQKLKEKLKEEIESQSKIPLGGDAAELLLDSIAQHYHKEPETLTWLKDIALNNQHEWVRRVAVESISKYYHTEPETLTWLKDIAFNDQDERVRWAAVESLVQYYHTEP
jgi:NACHT domain/HEAT repeats